MRTIKFIVEDQYMKVTPSNLIDDLVPGTEEYLRCEFHFSSKWDGYIKVASFTSRLGYLYESRVLDDGLYCIVPSESLKKRIFKVQITGKKGESFLTTNKCTVIQGGKNI